MNSRGLYNIYNVLASFSVADSCSVSFEAVKSALEKFKPQTGRMEKLSLKGKEAYLLLAKNPAGFNVSISAISADTRKKDIYLAINNRISDGVDVSWLKDVDFRPLINENTLSFTLAGTQIIPSMERLKEQGAENISTFENMKDALESIISNSNGDVIYLLANYTALYETKELL